MGQTSNEYNADRLGVVWRVQYGLGAVVVTIVVACRMLYSEESEAFKESQSATRERSSSLPKAELEAQGGAPMALFKHYWPRLIGTAVAWCVWDVVFYGNKLFQGKFIKIIEGGDSSLIQQFQYTLVNNFVALIGYWCSAAVID